MKKLFFFIAMAIISFATAQRPLITKWSITDGSKVIKFRCIGNGTYTWTKLNSPGETGEPKTGSGTFTSGLVAIDVPTFNFPVNSYIISIAPTGSFRFIFENSGLSDSDIRKFSAITQWGDVKWNPALTNMFYNVSSLNITATDVPNFSNVTDMSGLFYGCYNIVTIPNISQWDTSQVTNMASMFNGAYNFNDDISSWDTSNVTNMQLMFNSNYYDSKFNQPIGSWDVSKVTNMSGMFSGAKSFNQPLNNWNTSNVTSMSGMFYGASSFNQPLSNWNTSNVTNMSSMFSEARSFNQPLNNWNTSKVISMAGMFTNADAFNQPLNNWDVSNVTSMNSMFYNASKFSQPLDKWNVSKVGSFTGMFHNASSFNQNLGMWTIVFNYNYQTDMYQMLNNSGLDCINYGKTLQGWSNLILSQYKPYLGVQNLTYGAAAIPYRDALIAKGWTITGDYLDPDCDAMLGLNETKNKIALQMFPNPTADYFKMNSLQADVLSLYDMSGKLMKTQKLTVGQNSVDISNFPKGVYIAKTANASAKIIKK